MRLIISILITAIAYLLVPLVFSIIGLVADRRYSPKTVWAIVIINGVCVWSIFQIIRLNAGEEGTGAAVFLWSTIAYWMLRIFQSEEKEPKKKKEKKEKKKKYIRQFTEEPAKPTEASTEERKKRHDELSAVVVKMIGDQELLEMVKTLSNLDTEKRQAVKGVLTAFSKDKK